MKPHSARILALAVLVLCGGPAIAQSTVFWALPNFSDRVEVRVANPGNTPLHTLAVLDIAKARSIAPGFPGTVAIVAEQTGRTRYLPSQVDAGSNGESAGAFVFPVNLAPHQQQELEIYYSPTLHEDLPWPKLVHATHSYGYNRATAAIESDLIGYRTYGGFFFDVQAREKNECGLFNSLIGYTSISSPPVEGQDVIHLGDTLGLGGIFLRSGDAVYRPPLNTPDYLHRAPKQEEPTYRILKRGPLRALVEADLPRWTIGSDAVAVHAIYEMRAGEEVIRCHVWITPLRLSRSYRVGAGFRDLPQMHSVDQPGVMAIDGVQEKSVGRIALGAAYNTAISHRAGELTTPDARNEIIMFNRPLTAGHTVEEEYAVAAAWQGSGWAAPVQHVAQVLREVKIHPEVALVLHQQTPHPERLKSEPK
jgi:hypothetical protein